MFYYAMSDQQKTRADRWVARLKNNPLVAFLAAVVFVWGIISQLATPINHSLKAIGIKHEPTVPEADQDLILREYFKAINELLSNDKLSPEGSKQKSLARNMTQTTLARLDASRRSSLFSFLREAKFPVLSGNKDEWGGNFQGFDLRKTDMSRSSLVWAWFYRANLSGASLANSNLQNAVFTESNLKNANLYKANAQLGQFFGANLSEADLRSADLRWAFFKGATLNGANFTGANLENADLSSVKWDQRTIWPSERDAFNNATLPPDLKAHLGI